MNKNELQTVTDNFTDVFSITDDAGKVTEETLNRSRKLEAIGQLTSGIAHDYNNMLGVIIGNIQMVERVVALDDKSREHLGKALAAAQRNAELTAKLLGFSRAQPRRKRHTAANDFIAGLKDIIATSLTAAFEIRADLSEDLWLVDIDPAELEDMILNLAINARDAMPDGGVLTIESVNKVLDENHVNHYPESRPGDYVMISVSDTGTGMSKETREQIFDPFFSTKETGKGTGLGLSMVHTFVQRSSGFIMVYSEPGKGTTFNVFLPRAQGSAVNVTTPDEAATTEISRGSETILIVDDEDLLVDLAVMQLEELGYHTLCAGNAAQALEILKANPDIDLLLSDIIMPGKLDGYDLALAAKQIRPSVKILMTSGSAKVHGKSGNETIARLDANRLNKPYTLAELSTAVRRRLDEND